MSKMNDLKLNLEELMDNKTLRNNMHNKQHNKVKKTNL